MPTSRGSLKPSLLVHALGEWGTSLSC
jgi:hypothetical protein